MEIIKFGGTSLATKKQMEKTLKFIKPNEKKVIVVSAMGREGFPYATDSLKKLLYQQVTHTEEDRLLATGEIISSVVFSSYLNHKGYKAIALSYLQSGVCFKNGDVYVDSNSQIRKALNTYDQVIIPGFIGANENNEVVTLGRGNSDLSAVLLADYFKTNKVILYKDVEGVYPFIHSPLKKLKAYKSLSFDEVELMLNIGARVISLDALQKAKKENINLVIASLEDESKKTIISSSSKEEKKIIGFQISEKTFKIATYYPCLIKEQMQEVFYKSHVILKNEAIDNNLYVFALESSQISLIKRKIIEKYFASFIREAQ